MRRIFPIGLPVILLIIATWMVAGCSTTSKVYTMSPKEVETIRTEMNTVGVTVSVYPVKIDFIRPARGVAGGAVRGAAVGAMLPVMAGLVSPIPFGAIIGLLFVPYTAVAGSVYGAIKAPPANEVDKKHDAIKRGLFRLHIMDLKGTLQNQVVRLGNNRTNVRFTPLRGIGLKSRNEVVPYDQLDVGSVDTVLEIRAEKVGLEGPYNINPPSEAFIQLRVQIIRMSDNVVIWNDKIFCHSEERDFTVWAENDGQYFYEDVLACIPLLAEKIVDDYFLVHPLP